jgi:hypothetical protein
LQELSQEKYEEFSILFAQELNALTPEDYVIDKRIGLTSYDIYWNEAKVEWDAVTVKSGQEINNPGEFYPVVVPFYQNENGQWCTTDENTGVEIVIPDKYLNGKSFMEWAQAGPIELNAQIPELMVNAKLAVEPDTSAEKLDAIRKEYLINRPLKLVAVINPNHPQGNNITAAKWFGSVKGPTIDFPEEGAKIIEHSTNTLMVPIILNGKPVAAINVAQRFRGVYIAVEFDQNGNVVDASGWGDGTSGGFGQKPNDNWVLVLALKSPDSAEGAGGGDIFNETDTADYFTVLSGIQNASSVNQIKKILEGTNFIYGEAYDLIFQR